MRPWQLELVAPQGQAIRARSALRPQGAKLLRARHKKATDCCPRLFCYVLIAARVGCPIRGKLFGHAVPKIHKNSLLKTTSTFYTRFLRSAGYNNRAPENRSEARFLGRGGAALQVVHFAFRQNADSIGARRRGRNDKDAVLYRDPSSRCAPQDDRGRGEFCRFAPAHRQNGASAK